MRIPPLPALRTPRCATALGLAAGAALLAGCLGGGGDDAPASAVTLSGTVADGPLQGATVCLDLDDDLACDSDEPQASTDADGAYRIEVAAAQAGAHAVVAQVPASAIDKDSGSAIGTAMLLRAPPSGVVGAQTVFISPLSTVVADTMAQSGIGVAEAAASVQAQLGLVVSPLGDFTASGADTALGDAARAVGRVMRDTAQLAADAGVSASASAALLRTATVQQLPVLAAALAAAPAQASAAQRSAAAAAAVAQALGLDATNVAAIATVLTAPGSASDTAGPFVSVRRFTYSDADNYSYQLFSGDSSQTDASGAFVANEPRAERVGGVDIPFSRNQMYWSGSAWINCDNGHAVVSSIVASAGAPQRSLYCGAMRTESRSVWEDIGGQTLRAVIARMRAFPLRDNVGSTTDERGLPLKWGPDPALLPADAVFPAGAKYAWRSAISNLGTTDRIELEVKPTVRHPDGMFRQAATLDQLGLMGGNLANATAVVDNLNSLFVEDVALPAPPDPGLQPYKRWRLAVDVAQLKGRFYRCDVLQSNGRSQSCEAMGDANLALQTQGGIRLLRVASGYPPALLASAQRQRFWAEQVGTVFRGSTDLPRSYHEQRLNGVAWDALRSALALPAHTEPAAPAGAGPFETLRNFSFTDALNYSWRRLTGDSSVLDSEGYFSADEQRMTVSAGIAQPFARRRAYWTGSAWLDCPSSGPVSRTQSAPPHRSVYCEAQVDERVADLRISLDGRLMGDVVNEIRSYAGTDNGASHAGWGPRVADHPILTRSRFPAGSTLTHRGMKTVSTAEAIATDPDRDRLRIAPSATSTEPFASWPLAGNLEQVIAGYPGGLKGGPVNGNTTLFVWSRTEAPSNPAYTDRVEIRVAFDAEGRKARFTRNNRLLSNGFSTNYVTLLDTGYRIETLGDARMLKFHAMPEGFEENFRFTRLYAERNGAVWYASKDRVNPDPNWSIRLNGPASQALRTALGIE